MGKILESIGIIEGYDIKKIGKLRIKNDKLFKEIIKDDKKIQDEAKKIIYSSGKVFAIIKKGIIKGIYLFKFENKEEEKYLKHVKTIYLKDVPARIINKYDDQIIKIAKDYVSTKQYNKIEFDNKTIQVDSSKPQKERTLAIIGGFVIGFALGWTIFEKIYWAILYGFLFAPIFSGLDTVITTKEKPKRNKISKSKKQ